MNSSMFKGSMVAPVMCLLLLCHACHNDLAFFLLKWNIDHQKSNAVNCIIILSLPVLGYLPNGIHAVEAMLAAASIGAIWSSTSVDFGVNVRTFLYFLIYIYLSQTFIPLCCIKAVINQLYLIWHLRCSLYICGCKLGSSIPVAVLGLLYYISSWSFICSYWRIGK